MAAARKVLFVDRDGTLIEEPADYQVDAIDKVRLLPHVIRALQMLQADGYELVMVTNQDGLGTESFPIADFEKPHQFVIDLFASQGITFSETFICPHLPEAGCHCRKPAAGLVSAYLTATSIDAKRSAMVGDRQSDIEFANNLGIRGFLLDATCDWAQIADSLCGAPRTAAVQRGTNETSISVELNLDATRPASIDTGLGFFDHMLDQIAQHAGIALTIKCEGDLHIDEHHTVEDVALTLGSAIAEALGNKRGIGRYGFTLPMDESLATVAVDLSGRPAVQFVGSFPRDAVGGMSIEMVRHFFASLAQAIGAAIHITVSGDNTHHMVEACFKSTGRALRLAFERRGRDLPSTKGML